MQVSVSLFNSHLKEKAIIVASNYLPVYGMIVRAKNKVRFFLSVHQCCQFGHALNVCFAVLVWFTQKWKFSHNLLIILYLYHSFFAEPKRKSF